MARGSSSRREFLRRVGGGMLVAGLGVEAIQEMGLSTLFAEELSATRLQFGGHDRLVDLLQSTPVDRFLKTVVAELRQGVTLKDLIAAAALANARAFGGEDYIGFHTFMALMPALRMSAQLPSDLQALPVLKVLYRQAARLEETDHHAADTLLPVVPTSGALANAETLLKAVHDRQRAAGDSLLAGLASESPEAAWNNLLPAVEEAPEVHRIVLAHRAWDMLGLVGHAHAETMLRQSLHYCVNVEEHRQKQGTDLGQIVAKVLDRTGLHEKQLGMKPVDDGWLQEFSNTLLKVSPEEAAQAAGDALVEGIPLSAICDAAAVAANQLVLRDPGRPKEWSQPHKPEGSVHGDSIGVHASDTANAWRQIVAVSNPRNSLASVIVAVWNISRDAKGRPLQTMAPRPLPEFVEKVTATDPVTLVSELDMAIREQNQDGACAITSKYLEAGHAPAPVLDLMLRYACSEDGALHAEKYFWTVSDEYSHLPVSLRNGQIIALARVTASQYGTKAPGIEEAAELLKSG